MELNMANEGKYVPLDLSSVKDSAKKTIDYLNKKLPQVPARPRLLIFLGETHRFAIDQDVTQAMLSAPPVAAAGATWVIFERGLDDVYVPGHAFSAVRTEPTDHGLDRRARSKVLAKMAHDAFVDGGAHVVYMPCGSAHSQQVFDDLDKLMPEPFTYISKPSNDD
jgi:hypothetical protein